MRAAVLVIESRQNPKFRQWYKYATHPERPDCPWLPLEGWKAVSDLSSNHPIELLLYSSPEDERLESLLFRARETACLSSPLLDTISGVETSQGIVAFFAKPEWDWSHFTDRLIYVHKLQDPGNLGTLIRTAHATGFSVVTSPDTVSCFNSKVVRASAGSIFAVPFLQGHSVPDFKSRGYRIWATVPERGQSLFDVKFSFPLAVLVGNEAAGLDQETIENADAILQIPMEGGAASLNAAIAGSVILYEVFRQRLS